MATVERETPFSFTEKEYEDFKRKANGYRNELESEGSLFDEMRDDLARFGETETCRRLVSELAGGGGR